MYRELGQDGTLFGLREGPYTGPPRTFDQRALPPHVLDRLRDVIEGAAWPAPILRREGDQGARPLRASAAAGALAVGALVGLSALHFGQASALIQGPLYAPLYALAGAAGAAAAWRGWRERRGLLARRGTYLLPLDIVEVRADTLVVSPLGGVRQVTIEGSGGAPALVLTFVHGARHVFPVKSERDAELAHEALELSQEHLEALSGAMDLEKALDLDPFFTLRGTGRQGQGAGGWALDAPAPSALRWGLVAAAGALAALGLWKARNLASDQTLFDRATAIDTADAYENYLSVGAVQRAEATVRRDKLRALDLLRAENDRNEHDEQVRARRDRAAAAVEAEAQRAACEPTTLPGASPAEAAACYDRRATRGHPGAAAWFRQRILKGTPLRVRLTHGGDPKLSAHLDEREAQLFDALRLILGEVAPARLLPVTRADADASADLRVATRVTPGATPQAAVYVFDVTLATPTPVTFQLSMPAAKGPLALRPRSLYTAGDPGPPREAQLMSARAYDRLYDELYGLFFDGNPRVPLRPEGPRAAPAASAR